jgi:anti-anti-sigma regulatory factor
MIPTLDSARCQTHKENYGDREARCCIPPRTLIAWSSSKIPAPRAGVAPPVGEQITPETTLGRSDPMTASASPSHWHLVGGSWRPLHEQLNSLSDAATWGGVSAPESPSDSGIAGPVVLAETLTIASVQCGRDYAAVVVSGALDRVATGQLRATLRGLIRGRVRSLLIDLSHASGADGRLGLVLDRAETSLRSRQGRLVLLDVPPDIRSSLDVGRLSRSFAICASSAVGPAASRAHPTVPSCLGPGTPLQRDPMS